MATLPETNEELAARRAAAAEKRVSANVPLPSDARIRRPEDKAKDFTGSLVDVARRNLASDPAGIRKANGAVGLVRDAVAPVAVAASEVTGLPMVEEPKMLTPPPQQGGSSDLGEKEAAARRSPQNDRINQAVTAAIDSARPLPEGIKRSQAERYGVPIYVGQGEDGVRIFSGSASGVAAMGPRAGGLRRTDPIAGDKRFEAQDFGDVKVPGFVDQDIATANVPTFTAEEISGLTDKQREEVLRNAQQLDGMLAEQDSVQAFRAKDAERAKLNQSPVAGLRREEFDALPAKDRAELMQGAQMADAQAQANVVKAQVGQQRLMLDAQRFALDAEKAVDDRQRKDADTAAEIVTLAQTDPDLAVRQTLARIGRLDLSTPEKRESFLNSVNGRLIQSLWQNDAVRGANADKWFGLLGWTGFFNESGPATVSRSQIPGDAYRVQTSTGYEYVDAADVPGVNQVVSADPELAAAINEKNAAAQRYVRDGRLNRE